MNNIAPQRDAHRHTDLQTLQVRVAYRMVACLSAQAAALPQDITERLRIAREQALAAARQTQRAAAPGTVFLGKAGGSVALGSSPSWWLRVVSFTPLLLLVAGLMLIQHRHDQAQINAAAEIDAALLADDLPPAAYADPGFAEFLKQRSR